MAWTYLLIAGIFEVVWAYAMKLGGFSKPWPTVVMFVGMAASVWLLAVAMRSLPLGTSYMVWTGIGAVGSFLLGWLVLGEQVSGMKLAAALMITLGILLMKAAD